ncbi:MAG: hypothetical protein AAF660_08715 [Pseudomonadota bacterium]
MGNFKRFITASAAILIAAGCSTTAVTGGAERVAFGGLNLISNGHEVSLGGGLDQRDAVIGVRDTLSQRLYTSRVSDGGQFALTLMPGDYLVETIAFDYHGEKIEAPANFRFSVPSEFDSVYIGSVTLEASLESGIYGVVGTADRYTIDDECAVRCDEQLSSLGLQTSTSGVSLMSWDYQVAANR